VTRLAPSRVTLLAALAVAGSGAVWGAFWIPLRHLESIGLVGPWATIGTQLAAVLSMLPIALWRWRRLKTIGGLLLLGMFGGCGFVLYNNALLATDVIHALLLFYLTPIWSTLLARLFLGHPITPIRVVTILMGFAGLAIILGAKGWLPIPTRLGDWMALASGVCWAFALVVIRKREDIAAFESTFAFFFLGLLAAVLLPLLVMPSTLLGNLPSLDDAGRFLPWIVLMGALLWVPGQMLLMWGSKHLDPGRVGILLMGEALVGAATAAIFTDEPFGWREMVGGALIVGAGLIDTLAPAPGDKIAAPVSA
jgi:drug/metabolite transporter (DMT)-like permease